MLAYDFWQERFAGQPDVVGRELRVNGRAFTVIGVVPSRYPGSGRYVEPRLYFPATMLNELSGFQLRENRHSRGFFGKARLSPGVSMAEAETAVASVAATYDATHPEGWDVGDRFRLEPTTEVLINPMLDPYIKQASGLLIVVVSSVLLLACTNLSSFMLARARDRQREVSVCLALGASRMVIASQLVTESTLLTLLGGLGGLLVAPGLLDAFLDAFLGADLPLPVPAPLAVDVRVDARALLFTFVVSAVAGLLLALVPALQALRPDVIQALRGGLTGGSRGQLRWRSALVATQLVISLVLLVGAGLFLRNLQNVLAVDPGFGRDPAVLVRVLLPPNRYSQERAHELTRRLTERFRSLPEVEAAGVSSLVPLSLIGGSNIEFLVDGHVPPENREGFSSVRAAVDPRFLDTLGIDLEGRGFTAADGSDQPRVAIVSRSMAKHFWPDGGAVGHILRLPASERDELRIVGVAADVSVRSIGEGETFLLYVPHLQSDARSLTFVARTGKNPRQRATSLLAVGRQIEPRLQVTEVKTMERHLATNRLPYQLAAFLLSSFAVLALLLSAIGLYGVMSYIVASRRREIGIRVALGASSSSIAWLLAIGSLRLVVVSAAVGLTLPLLMAQAISGLLFHLESTDPATFVMAPLILIATAILATYLPARRAGRASPVSALRSE